MDRRMSALTGRSLRQGVRDRLRRHASHDGAGERGAILILAMAYIIVVSVVVGALTTWASGDLNNTAKFNSVRTLDYSLSSAVEVAINSIRYTPLVGTNQTLNAAAPGSYCWGTGGTSTLQLNASSPTIAVYCSTLMDEQNTQGVNRTVTLDACVSGTSLASCAQTPQLQAIVVFDDYPSTGAQGSSAACTTYCGEGATLESWDWSSTDGLSPILPNSISIANPQPAIPLVGGTWNPQATANSGDTVVETSSAPLICSVNSSDVVSFLANGTCTITFSDPGNANYSPVLTSTTPAAPTRTLTVGPLANAITVTSTPSNPTVGGPTYTTVSSATSGDAVVVSIPSSSTGVCTVSSGVVSFVGNGFCTINFTDPGNTDYQSASAVQGPFQVGVGNPAGLSVLGNASPQNGYPGNGDSVVYTYNQTMTASSLKSGFTGSSTAVFVQLTRASSGSSTSWQVCATSNCSTLVNLGTINLGDAANANHYVAVGSTAVLNATMLMSTNSGDSVVTVTLGSVVSGTITALTPTTTTTTLTWTPSASATGTANGTACSTTAVTEANAPRANF
jgi:hypothetical protein